ncbi:MAG: T9SS type A sorting domain-containing protein [Bacteroidales bacterium]|nr:T9SS type A sorting domain-containing protein [Bacteroidales bacterium]
MIKQIQKTGLFIFLFHLSIILWSQSWTANLPAEKIKNGENFTFFEIQQAFYDYWEPYNVKNGYYYKNGEKIKAKGYKIFKRWEWFWQQRIDPTTGEFPKITAAEIREMVKLQAGAKSDNSDWSSMGPNNSSGGYSGIGRINCIGFRPDDNNTFYVGSPSGGLWKTTDAATNWTPLTDNNTVLGVSDVVVIAGITPATDILYIATGDRDLGTIDGIPAGHTADNHSIGVLKSTDGGSTWDATGLSFSASDKETTNRILLDPSDNNILYAATSDGLYKTTNSGTDWTKISTEDFVDIEFNTSNSATIYAATRTGGEIWLSTNSGSSFTKVLDVVGGYRTELAVSPNDADRVYAVVVNFERGLKNVWRSINGGSSFTEIYEEPVVGNGNQNLLHSNCSPGATIGGQGNYDLAIAADPNDAEVVYVGGINTWKSTDGASSFSIVNHWETTCGATVETVHADKHCLAFQNGTSVLFEGNDGGIYKTSNGGANWSDLSNGLVISQYYRIAIAQTMSNEMIGGLQDNGTKAQLTGTWTDVLGADGMDCAIDYTTEWVQYATKQYGSLYRTTDHWSSSTYISGSLPWGAWVTPLVIDPNAHNTIYFAPDDEVWKSTNRGTSWIRIGLFGGNDLWSIDVAPANSDYIYAGEKDVLRRTTNGGTDWADITGSLPVSTSYITSLTVSNADANRVWVCMGNYNSDCVYETTNGGSIWTNISAGLPNVPVLNVVENLQNTMATELYAATDVGVYQKVGSADWVSYSTNLPNVVVTDLEIFYMSANPAQSRLRAGTYGRGAWETELPPAPPVAEFSVNNPSPTILETVIFSDFSTGSPTAWLWTFDPATVTYMEGTSSSSQNPQVRFDAIDDYTVTLYAENAQGNDSETKTDYISSTDINYCSASGGSVLSTWEYISGVEMGTIDNTGTDPDEYSDYTAQSTDIGIGETVNITVTIENCYFQNDLGVWIDWNKDGDFDDDDENIICVASLEVNGLCTYEGSFAVPTHANLVSTRMRVRVKYDDNDCGSPCGSTDYGEVEDYSVMIVPGPISWSGSTSGDWSVSTNWHNNTVPSTKYNVTVPESPIGENFPQISSETEAICNNLSIENHASLNVYGTLNVEGNFLNEAGNTGLVIKFDASNTGSMIVKGDAIGNVSFERHVDEIGKSVKWHYVSSPVAGQSLDNSWMSANSIAQTSGHYQFFRWDEDTYYWIIYGSIGEPESFGDETFVQAQGYCLSRLGTGVLNFSGTIRTSDLNYATTYTEAKGEGFNLVGNPFTCALSITGSASSTQNFLTQNSELLDDSFQALYIWDEQSEYSESRNDYKIISNAAIGEYTRIDQHYIQPGQAFMVKVTSGGGNLAFNESMQAHSSVDYYKNSKELWPSIELIVENNELFNSTAIGFNENMTLGLDPSYDVGKMKGHPNIALYTKLVEDNGVDFAIQALPPLNTEKVEVKVGLDVSTTGNYNFKLIESENFDETTSIKLEDKETGSLIDLREIEEYSFNIIQIGQIRERFVLHFNNATGIEDQSLENSNISFYVYDNKIYIIDKEFSNGTIQLFNLLGQAIIEKQYSKDISTINLDLTKGYYFVRIFTDKTTVSGKIYIH